MTVRLSFDQLVALWDASAGRLVWNDASVRAYVREWDDLVEFAGWTIEEVEQEIDARWDKGHQPEHALPNRLFVS